MTSPRPVTSPRFADFDGARSEHGCSRSASGSAPTSSASSRAGVSRDRRRPHRARGRARPAAPGDRGPGARSSRTPTPRRSPSPTPPSTGSTRGASCITRPTAHKAIAEALRVLRCRRRGLRDALRAALLGRLWPLGEATPCLRAGPDGASPTSSPRTWRAREPRAYTKRELRRLVRDPGRPPIDKVLDLLRRARSRGRPPGSQAPASAGHLVIRDATRLVLDV